MSKNTPVAIFASGTGSNFEAIVQADLPCEIVMLVCDKLNAPVIEKAKNMNIPTLVLNPKRFLNKAAYEEKILFELKKVQVEWIFLAGYMRLIGDTLLEIFDKRIINIHPSLLPEFPGKDAIQQAFNEGVSITGISVHYVDEGMDTGTLIRQEKLPVHPGETLKELTERIHKLEHKLYPEVIAELLLQKSNRH